MGCMRSQFKYIDTDGNKQIDMKRVSQYKNTRAQLLSPTTGLNHRLEQSSYHRTQRKDNQRKPKPDLVNLASPMSSPRLITSPNDNRHRRAGAMLLRRLRSLCNKIAPDKQGKAERFYSIEEIQKEALQTFGRSGKSAMQLMVMLNDTAENSSHKLNRDNGYLINMCWNHLLVSGTTVGELKNANVQSEIFVALARITPDMSSYASTTINSILLLTRMSMDGNIDLKQLISESTAATSSTNNGNEEKNAINILRALEWISINAEVTERVVRCYCDDIIARQHLQKNQNQKQKQRKQNRSTNHQPKMYTFPMSVGARAVALRKMSGSAYYERLRRELPKHNSSTMSRKERQAIQVLDDQVPLLTWINNTVSNEHSSIVGQSGIIFLRFDDLENSLVKYQSNERLLLHLLLEIIDELECLGFLGTDTELKTKWGAALQTAVISVVKYSVEAIIENDTIVTKPVIMAAATRLWYLFQFQFQFQSKNDKSDKDPELKLVANTIRKWKLRNSLVASSLPFRFNKNDTPRTLLQATNTDETNMITSPLVTPRQKEKGGTEARIENQIKYKTSPIRSPTSIRNLEMSQHFSELQSLVENKGKIDPDVLDQILLHCSTVIVDDQSSDDNKLEVGTFLLDVLSLSRQCRKLMRQSKYWIDVEQVLNWCHCNDVLFLNNPTQSMESIRSAGLHRLDIVMEVTKDTKDMKEMKDTPKITKDVKDTKETNETTNTLNKTETKSRYAVSKRKQHLAPTSSGNLFLNIVHEWKTMRRFCKSFLQDDTIFEGGRSDNRLNDWQMQLSSAGQVVARASLDGPIGIVSVMDFHAGNLFILERSSTLLAMDNCSPSVLIAAGFVEVAARSLRKSKPSHPFFLTTLVKTTSLIIKAFEEKSTEVTERLFNCEREIIMLDCLKWADSNASVFLPVIKRPIDSWTLSMKPECIVKVGACIYESPTCESEKICGINPQEKVDVLQTTQNGWVHVIISRNEKSGWLKMCGYRTSCLERT